MKIKHPIKRWRKFCRSTRLLASNDSSCPGVAVGVACFLARGFLHFAHRIWVDISCLFGCDCFRSTLDFVGHSIFGVRYVDLAAVPTWAGARILILRPILMPILVCKTNRAQQHPLAHLFAMFAPEFNYIPTINFGPR